MARSWRILDFMKIASGEVSYGRGIDNWRQPGTYGVFYERKLVARIECPRLHPFDPPLWHVQILHDDGTEHGVGAFRTLRAAREKAERVVTAMHPEVYGLPAV